MVTSSTRRHFLELTGVSVGMAGLGITGVSEPENQERPTSAPAAGSRPKIAALASVYTYLSHAYHIVGRFLDGFAVHDGHGLHKPPFEVVSLFIEQTPEATDLGRAKAQKNRVRFSPTIADALTLGTGRLAVERGVVDRGTWRVSL